MKDLIDHLMTKGYGPQKARRMANKMAKARQANILATCYSTSAPLMIGQKGEEAPNEDLVSHIIYAMHKPYQVKS